MPNFPSFNVVPAPSRRTNSKALHLMRMANPRSTAQSLAALVDAVLGLSKLSNDLVHTALPTAECAAVCMQLKQRADYATEAMQQLRAGELGLSPPATQLSQALTVLVLVASLLQNQPAKPLDSELSALLSHNTRRALHSLSRLLALHYEQAAHEFAFDKRSSRLQINPA